MPIVEWSDTFKLGVPLIDGHHQKLVGLLNKVYDDVAREAPATETCLVLQELFEYTTYHFRAEEDWMKENGYPGLAGHIELHEEFSSKLDEIVIDYLSGKPNPNNEVFTFLTDWLLKHILKSDAAVICFTAENKNSTYRND